MHFSVAAVTRPGRVGDRRPDPDDAIGLTSGLTLSQETAIRGLWQAGHDVDHLAELYGVSPRVIGAILRRKGTS
ncbi:MAG TPA: hypothetical protein VG013_33800 [Gemmataceae bacterium]|jgi:hypothetical protein|nr:hypothetical protein [Gemmataceae bacterium]